jgi:hypothetical protein
MVTGDLCCSLAYAGPDVHAVAVFNGWDDESDGLSGREGLWRGRERVSGWGRVSEGSVCM